MFLTVEITKAEDQVRVRCAELDLEAVAPTSEKALAKLKKIIDFYMATAKEGTAVSIIGREDPGEKPTVVH